MKMLLFTLLMTASLVQAQEISPKKNIEALHFFEGKWSIDNYVLNEKKWESVGITNSEITLELNGKFVSEKVTYLTKFGQLNMITMIGFDSRLNNFKLSNMGENYGYMDIYFGEWINEDLVFTNLESDLPSKLDDGRELSFRVTYSNMSHQGFTHLVEGTLDKGKTWFSFSKSVYSKIIN